MTTRLEPSWFNGQICSIQSIFWGGEAGAGGEGRGLMQQKQSRSCQYMFVIMKVDVERSATKQSS